MAYAAVEWDTAIVYFGNLESMQIGPFEFVKHVHGEVGTRMLKLQAHETLG